MAKKTAAMACQGCGTKMPRRPGSGAQRKYCDACAPPEVRQRRNQYARRAGMAPQATTPAAPDARAAALELSMGMSPEEIAKRLGVTGEVANALIEEARSLHSDFVELSPAAIGKLDRYLLAKSLLRIEAGMDGFEPQQMPNLIKCLVNVRDSIDAGGNVHYHDVSITFDCKPEDAD